MNKKDKRKGRVMNEKKDKSNFLLVCLLMNHEYYMPHPHFKPPELVEIKL
jgi:hypothetical protein